MRALKWMTVFASLALFSLAVQAQGQSGRDDITGDAALDIWEADTVGNPARETHSDYDSWWQLHLPITWYGEQFCLYH